MALRAVEDRTFGCQTMTGPLLRVIVRRPDEYFANADPDEWNYVSRPILKLACAEHDDFTALLRRAGAQVIYHSESQPNRADAIYTYDPVLITDAGAVVLRMGKPQRRGEEASMARLLQSLGLPILGTITDPGSAEGGDLLWLDPQTLAIGIGFRTNLEGAQQLSALLRPLGVSTLEYQLPYYRGASSCLHLMSLLSLVDQDLAVIYAELLPVSLWMELRRRGIQLVEVPENEFADGMASNVLATAPRQCIMLRGNPVTEQRLREAGCEVHTFSGDEISLKAEGGATCLTRPILRATVAR